MAAAFQQQIFALDARFNAYRAPNNPNFSKLMFYFFIFIIDFMKDLFIYVRYTYVNELIILLSHKLVESFAPFIIK